MVSRQPIELPEHDRIEPAPRYSRLQALKRDPVEASPGNCLIFEDLHHRAATRGDCFPAAVDVRLDAQIRLHFGRVVDLARKAQAGTSRLSLHVHRLFRFGVKGEVTRLTRMTMPAVDAWRTSRRTTGNGPDFF